MQQHIHLCFPVITKAYDSTKDHSIHIKNDKIQKLVHANPESPVNRKLNPIKLIMHPFTFS